MINIFAVFISLIYLSCTGCAEKTNPTVIDLDKISVEENSCETKIKSLKFSAIKESENRMALLYSAKAHPIFFLEEPKYDEPEEKDKKIVAKYRELFHKNPWKFLIEQKTFLKSRVNVGRHVFLRSGYLYSDSAREAQVLSQNISLDLMFQENHLWIQRGSITMEVEKIKGKY